jgi:hypothetical protein
MSRYDRVEGLSLEAGAALDFGPWTAGATGARSAVPDLWTDHAFRPNPARALRAAPGWRFEIYWMDCFEGRRPRA